MSTPDISFLLQLEQVIAARKADASEHSYTAKLFRAGAARIAQKVGEEGVELALASVTEDREKVVSEAADLLYHMLVCCIDVRPAWPTWSANWSDGTSSRNRSVAQIATSSAGSRRLYCELITWP